MHPTLCKMFTALKQMNDLSILSAWPIEQIDGKYTSCKPM